MGWSRPGLLTKGCICKCRQRRVFGHVVESPIPTLELFENQLRAINGSSETAEDPSVLRVGVLGSSHFHNSPGDKAIQCSNQRVSERPRDITEENQTSLIGIIVHRVNKR